MIEQAQHQLAGILAKAIFPGLIGLSAEAIREKFGAPTPGVSRLGPGHFATRGIGTYAQFLESAGALPPDFRRLAPGCTQRAFREACEEMARRIINKIDRSGGIDVSTLKAEVLRGPITIYRAIDQKSVPWGAWWFDESTYVALVSATRGALDRVHRQQLREALRRHLAIRRDWNDVTGLRKMTVLSGAFPAVTGRGAPQPASSSGDDPAVLRGGALQYWLPWPPLGPLDEVVLST